MMVASTLAGDLPMGLSVQVLGDAGRDNAVLVLVDSGQAVRRLLFDCGDGCLGQLPFGEVQTIDHLFFSHLHMDHVGGFDTFFRCTFNRTARENHVWGPPRTADILHHRFRGFLWNLHEGQDVRWQVHDLHPGRIATYRFELAEAFERSHAEGDRTWDRTVVAGPGFTVEALRMDHGTPSVAYLVREADRVNIDTARLAALGLRPGPWLKRLRGPRPDDAEAVVIDGKPYRVADLQAALLVVSRGESVAYLTDFVLDEAAQDRLAEALRGVTAVVCESQYRDADRELARRTYHMTATQAAIVARRAGVGRLVLFHLSDRYRPKEWREMLAEAQAVFPATAFPDQWAVA
jgi:ribonuclease Z